jgi:hypothetical protein
VPSKRWKCRFRVPKFKKISGSIPPDLPNLESVPLTFWDGLTPLSTTMGSSMLFCASMGSTTMGSRMLFCASMGSIPQLMGSRIFILCFNGLYHNGQINVILCFNHSGQINKNVILYVPQWARSQWADQCYFVLQWALGPQWVVEWYFVPLMGSTTMGRLLFFCRTTMHGYTVTVLSYHHV